tara:strand:+ start:119 stop:616 length:498 start_codon:yes stop_codon:yes gene_type:complete
MKKIILSLFFVSILATTSIAGSHAYNAVANFRCMQHFGPAQMMGQMPLHINGEFRCAGEMEFNGKKMIDSSHCVVSNIVINGRGSFTGTCRNYSGGKTTLFIRFTDTFAIQDQSGEGEIIILGGEGDFKGATGSGVFTWNSAGNDPNDSSWSMAHGISKMKIDLP